MEERGGWDGRETRRDWERVGREKPTHPETLGECAGAGAKGGQAQGEEREVPISRWERERGEGRPGPVRSDTPPHPVDTPPSDPGPEERVQSQQTAETHGLRASGGAAPRRAWYGGRAGSRALDSRGDKAGGGRGCRGGVGVGGKRELSRGGRRRRRRRHSLSSREWEPGRRRRPLRGSGAGPGLWVRGPSGLCSVSLPFSSPAVKFACFPGAYKNSLLRSLASRPSVPAPSTPSPWSGIVETMT